MTVERVPLAEEPIYGTDEVRRYDRYAGLFIRPEYKYFVWKILHRGIKSGKVLDVGTGSGRLAIELAKAKGCNFDIIGLDISEDMLKKARENARRAGVEDKIKFCLGSASILPFQNKSFDLVISYASLHHWFQPVNVLNEISRVVKSTGTIIIRDNRRVYGNFIWEFAIQIITLFQNKHNHERWPKAILASYTIPEVEDIFQKSNLRNCHIGTDFVRFDVSIETPRKPGSFHLVSRVLNNKLIKDEL